VTGRILFITGTDTDVGKTIATAAVAAALIAQRPPTATGPLSVAVDKPVQTGVLPGEAGDVDVVRHLAGVRATTEGIRLRRPMAPVPAARHDGVALPTLDEHAARIRELAQHYERVLVEGAGDCSSSWTAQNGPSPIWPPGSAISAQWSWCAEADSAL